jgi:hypothetical protein
MRGGRGTNPAQVADVFVFLASDESESVAGKRFQAQEDWKARNPIARLPWSNGTLLSASSGAVMHAALPHECTESWL